MQYTAKKATTYSKRKKFKASVSFLDNLCEMHEWMNCIFYVLLNSILVISGQ